MTIRQKAVVSNALKSSRQDMLQETTEKFVGRQRHGAQTIPRPIVAPLEPNLAMLNALNSIIGNGHSMGVTTKIFENRLWPSKGRFGVYHPLASPVLAPGMAHNALRAPKSLKEEANCSGSLL